ncbi:polysaccharide biosynthesis C-terminal domain-containing protein [Deltaproteobacteria bacterium OttesenSCG-928-K17]|nr:polysaccharide biosynthesis C-terminal domain-containing protein [Deltaproteobacteria bacterium OttesenSCG-928-K17]
MFADLKTGSAVQRLLSFSIPIFFTNFLQVFYALTDMAVVGRFVGDIGLAAIANGSIVAYLVGSIGTGLAVGGAVVIGHYKGAGNIAAQNESLGTLLILAALAAALVSPSGLIYAEDIFSFLEIPQTVLPEAASYLSVLCLGNPFFFCGTALSFALRSLGDSRSPLYFMLIAGLINITLDFLLVGVLSFGVSGAAAATGAAQFAALLFAAFYLKRKKSLKLMEQPNPFQGARFKAPLTGNALPRRGFYFKAIGFGPRLDQARRMLRIGLPSMVQLVMINLSYLAITVLINGYGVTAAAAAGIGIKICTLAVMPCWAVGQALTAMAANCLGAGDALEAGNLTRAALKLNLIITAAVVLMVQLAARPIMALFNPEAGEVIRAGVAYLRLCGSLGVIVYAFMYTCNCLATSAGAATVAMLNSLLDSVVMRLLLIGLFIRAGYGLTGIYLGQALSAVLPAVLGGLYFRSRLWRGKKVI